MRFTVTTHEFSDSIKWVLATARPAFRTSNPPSSGGIMLTAGPDGTITASAAGSAAVARVGTDGAAVPGRVLCPAQELAAALAALPHRQDVTVEFHGAGRASIWSKPSLYALSPLPADGFPEPPVPGPHAAEFEARPLAAAVARAVRTAGDDDTLPVLTCVRLQLFPDGTAVFTSTDRYRMTLAECPYIPGPDSTTGDVLLPARELADALRYPGHGQVKLALNRTAATFSTRDRRVTVPVESAGPFPGIDRIFPRPDEAVTTVTADTRVLTRAVTRAAAVAGPGGTVRLVLGGNRIRVRAGNSAADTGNIYAEGMVARISGKPMTIAFNSRYLLDGLISARAGTVRIDLTGPHQPALIAPANGTANVVYALMPVKTSQ